jgi:predicted ATPase
LDEHGANLASTLREMQRSKSPLLEPFRNAIQSVIPDVIDFQVSQVTGYLVTRLRHDMADDLRAMFELSQESDGTLRMLGILAALYQDPPRTLIALEEPELTIHPGALGLLWEEIEGAAERSQILVTTHSPDLLDMCRADQIRVVEKINGTTLVDPIEETQREAIQERLFAPGELLRAQGLQREQQMSLGL